MVWSESSQAVLVPYVREPVIGSFLACRKRGLQGDKTDVDLVVLVFLEELNMRGP